MGRQKVGKKTDCKADEKSPKTGRAADVLKEGKSFLKKHGGKLLTFLFFAVLFVFGLHFLPSVNGNFDENVEQNILLSNIKDYAEEFHVDEVTEAIHSQGILAISVDPNRDHGIAPYYLFAPILVLKSKYPHIVSVLWHFYTYCLAFLGVIFFYLLMQYLFKNKKMSIVLTMLYFLTPRIFVDSLHNNKDIVFMALLVVMIYFGVRLIREKEFRWAVLFALVGAFVCNIKILGLFFVGIVGLGYIAYLTIKKEWSTRNLLCGLTAAIAVLCLYIALTPAIWGDGHFALFEYIQYCLGNAVDFSANTAVMFEGVVHRHSENPLPWYYIPKLILVTIPIIISVLFIVSSITVVVDLIKNIKHRKFDFNNFVFILVLTMFLVPLGIAIFSNPNLYNGWRHFYFLYSLMVIVGSYAVFKFKDYKKINLTIMVLIGLTITNNVCCLFKYGMANTAYYNILLGTDNLAGVYELDYYNASSQEALKKFLASGELEENEDGMLYLYSTGFGEVVIGDMKTYINPGISRKIVLVTKDTIKKYQDEGKIIYNMSNPVYRYNDVSDYELTYSYKMFNNEVINFYKVN
ncbi:glycosyltransferase family 39 protein [Candidatus Saccharibacteria bacterium]|nr:glycosyltransferase family 39 protein [Candidatus Saccharibacteria bacterium]